MNSNLLKVAAIQSDLFWENKSANLSMFEEKCWQIEQEVDVIILPEMFTTGFSMNVEALAEPFEFHTLKWMKQMAKLKNALLIGSFIVKEGSSFYNRLAAVKPSGEVRYYDKRHLFPLSFENDFFEAGKQRLVVEHNGWKICPLICYDLRFPVWSSNVGLAFDVLVYIANWPGKRKEHWDVLLKARAIENQVYTVGVNRVGVDGHELSYSGDSAAYSFDGRLLALSQNEEILYFEFQKEPMDQYRQSFPIWKSMDDFEIKS